MISNRAEQPAKNPGGYSCTVLLHVLFLITSREASHLYFLLPFCVQSIQACVPVEAA